METFKKRQREMQRLEGEGKRPPGGSSESRIPQARPATDHRMMPQGLRPMASP